MTSLLVSLSLQCLLENWYTHQNVRDEDAMKFALLQQLSELDPMLNLVEACRLIIWMSP
jgi:hypothetical protein